LGSAPLKLGFDLEPLTLGSFGVDRLQERVDLSSQYINPSGPCRIGRRDPRNRRGTVREARRSCERECSNPKTAHDSSLGRQLRPSEYEFRMCASKSILAPTTPLQVAIPKRAFEALNLERIRERRVRSFFDGRVMAG
jgi:hypothetical protein